VVSGKPVGDRVRVAILSVTSQVRRGDIDTRAKRGVILEAVTGLARFQCLFGVENLKVLCKLECV
jgi:hypothetical protein